MLRSFLMKITRANPESDQEIFDRCYEEYRAHLEAEQTDKENDNEVC